LYVSACRLLGHVHPFLPFLISVCRSEADKTILQIIGTLRIVDGTLKLSPRQFHTAYFE
jgi:hypothetical protein